MRIHGKLAIVTGGGSGLGAATVRALAERGAKVAVVDFDAARAAEIAAQVGGFAAPADVADGAQVEAAFAAIEDHFGATPRVAVNCAGIAAAARIVGRDGQMAIDTFERVVRVNLVGSYIVMSHAVKAMMAMTPPRQDDERGVIINTASAAYQDGQIGQAAYAASKGGIAAMSLPAARELARFGIRVAAIAPGLFDTPMMETLPSETVDTIVANIPFPARLGAPSEFGLLACQIIENPYLNGTTIRLDGAVRLPPR